MLLATILGIATVFVSTPQDNEFKITDREIEVLEGKNNSSGFVEETSHESRQVSDRDDSTLVLQSEPLIDAKHNEEEEFSGKLTTNTCDLAPQAVQLEIDMNNGR